MTEVSNRILVRHNPYNIKSFKSNDEIAFTNPPSKWFIFSLRETIIGIEMEAHCKSAVVFNDSCTTCSTIFRELFSSKTK